MATFFKHIDKLFEMKGTWKDKNIKSIDFDYVESNWRSKNDLFICANNDERRYECEYCN